MSQQQLLTWETEKEGRVAPEGETSMFHAFPAAKQVVQGFSAEHAKALEYGLNAFYGGKQEESRLSQARRILGQSAANLSDEDLEVKVSEFQYLLECWMDTFERSIFSNQTLTQIMKGE
jgi:hypothetical protein